MVSETFSQEALMRSSKSLGQRGNTWINNDALVFCSVVDPDSMGSGSGVAIRIRIQDGKKDPQKLKKIAKF